MHFVQMCTMYMDLITKHFSQVLQITTNFCFMLIGKCMTYHYAVRCHLMIVNTNNSYSMIIVELESRVGAISLFSLIFC